MLYNYIAIYHHNGGGSHLEKESYVDNRRSIIEFKVKNGTGGTERRERRCADVVGKEQSLRIMRTKIDKMKDTKKILIEEQERIQGQVKSWEKKLRNMEVKVKGKGQPRRGHEGPEEE